MPGDFNTYETITMAVIEMLTLFDMSKEFSFSDNSSLKTASLSEIVALTGSSIPYPDWSARCFEIARPMKFCLSR